MRRVLIINRGVRTDNFGDEAINFCLKKLLISQNCFVDSANYTIFFEKGSGEKRSLLANIIRGINIVKKNGYDLVVFGGGQLIQGNKRFPWAFFMWISIIKLFSKSKIKTFGIGVDEKYTVIKKILFMLGFNFIDEFYVRDTESEVNLRRNFKKSAHVSPDVVFAMSEFYEPLMLKGQYLAFGITTYKSIKRYKYIESSEIEYLEEQTKLLLSFYDKNEVRIIYNTKEDCKYSYKLQDYVKTKYGISIMISPISDLFEYVDLVSSSKVIASSRMHALIIGLSYGVKIEPCIRNEKLRGFTQFVHEFNRKEYILSVQEGIKKLIE